MLLDALEVTADQFTAGTGWEIRPEGACKGEVCVPFEQSGNFDVLALAGRLRMAVVHDPDAGLWAVGPETLGGHVLLSVQAPELVLSDLAGQDFALRTLRGQKVVIVSWAPY